MKCGGGGGLADKPASGEDRLSALPDDILVLILSFLDTAAAAGRTSVLARRWRRVWALLPVLSFPDGADPHLVASALAAHEAPLRFLLVDTLDAAPESVTAWLRAAAPRLSGSLAFQNRVPERNEEEEEESGAFELPCLENATTIWLDLGFLGLAMPPAGVFARLTELSLYHVRLDGPCELGEAVSSPRCPCLQKLKVYEAYGMVNLAIHSESLLQVELRHLDRQMMRQLTIVAPALKELTLVYCFTLSEREGSPVANISTPQLVLLEWRDAYNPSSVQFGDLSQLLQLTACYFVYGPDSFLLNLGFLRLMEQFKVIWSLRIRLAYFKDIAHFQYNMEGLTSLPLVMSLRLYVINKGHVFGGSIFHVLRMCTGIRRLFVELDTESNLEAQSACPSGCICNEPTNWKTDELALNFLQEVEILGRG